MRPVTRGNPATYAPAPDITQSTEYLQQRLAVTRIGKRTYDDAIAETIDGIHEALDEHDITYVNPVGLTLPTDRWSLGELNDELEKLYNRMLDTGDFQPNDLLLVAQQRICVLQAMLAQYHATAGQHEDRIAAVYAKARRDLITNIGQYCSYCEMPLGASLAVEHMLPKKWFPLFSVGWNNFLLACPICNSIKSDNPNLDDGVKVIGPGKTYKEIADAAHDLYLWPSDTVNYPSFEGAFGYQMVKLLYDLKGGIIAESPFNPIELALLIQERRIQKIDQAGGHVRVEALTPLFQIDPPNSLPVINFLTGITAQTEINAANVNGVPAGLVAAFASFQNPAIPNVGNFHLSLGIAPNVYLEPFGQNRWRLSQNRGFQINFSNKIELYEGRDLLNEWTQGVKPMLLAIAAGNLPPNIVNFMKLDQFSVTTEFIQLDRGKCGLTVSRKYILQNEGGVIRVYADQVFSIEMRLATNNTKGTETLNGAALNRNYVKDVKQSDRRMARRVNAWFSAVQSLWNLENAMPVIHNDAGSATHLVEAIATTAALTGFWSVWRWVFLTYLPPGILQTALLNALNTKFTGTR